MTPHEPSPHGPTPHGEHTLSRRTLLAGALATTVAGAACRSAAPATPAVVAPTAASLTASAPFYIAHRGGGGDWPEMTAYAYEQASKIPGLQALEISVHLSADGVLVCHHDPTTTRVTGTNYTIAQETWATLSKLEVSAKGTVHPEQPARPLARLDDVLERYIHDFVLFLEPKVPAAEEPLMRRLVPLLNPDRVVWKQPLTSTRFGEAKDVGFTTWGYVLDDPSFLGDKLGRLIAEPTVDLVGIPVQGRPALTRAAGDAAADNGKQTIAWPITIRAERERALGFGATGLMTSNIAELMPPPAEPSAAR